MKKPTVLGKKSPNSGKCSKEEMLLRKVFVVIGNRRTRRKDE